MAGLSAEIASVRPVHVPPRLVPIAPPPPPVVMPIAPPPSQATPPSPPPAVAVAPSPPPKPVRSRSRRIDDGIEQEVVAIPVAAPIPTRPANDGAALLREAERAFAAGRHATALMYADRSRAATNDPRASRIAALSACRLRRIAKAEAAWQQLPLGQRTSVRNACREHGVELGAPKGTASSTPRS
jgi:hypothetical protein